MLEFQSGPFAKSVLLAQEPWSAVTSAAMFRGYVLASVILKGVLAQASLTAIETQQTLATPQRATTAETATLIGPERALDGVLIRSTSHLDFYAKDSFIPVDLEWLGREAETALSFVAARMGIAPRRRLAIAFRPPRAENACPPRGLAYWNEPTPQLILFANDKTSTRQILGVLAHEMAHLLQTERASMRHTTLSEGMATWAAGKYWEAWQGVAMVESVRASYREGHYLPLTAYYGEKPASLTPEGENCLRERDLRYSSWGAFFDFLIANYGIEKMFQLLGPPEVNPRPSPQRNAPPDFTGVYGLTLAQLEENWRRGISVN